MPSTPPRRPLRQLLVCAALAAAVGVGAAVPVAADEVPPDPSAPVSTQAPATTVAPTTTPPATIVAPTTAPPQTNPPATSPGTTAPPPAESSSTTTTTTLPADVADEDYDYANTAAPQVPSAESDPLFHAARTVDADLRAVDIARAAFRSAKATSLAQDEVAKKSAAVTEARAARDRAARTRLAQYEEELRIAALYAYTGYGAEQVAVDNPEISGATTVLPYVTYVRVTITEATDRVNRQQDEAAKTGRALAAAKKISDADARKATAERRVYAETKATLVEAKEKLEADMEALQELVGSLSDLAPGSLQLLPDDVELPEGASLVESPAGSIVVPATADPRTAVALQFIVAQIGKRYVWGGAGPDVYDCSGLMLRAFQAAGITSMPRVSQGQQVWARPIPALEAQPGDLVFFGTPAYHVGVYIGGGLMINAPYTGSVVRVDRIWSSFSGFGRPVWGSAPATAVAAG